MSAKRGMVLQNFAKPDGFLGNLVGFYMEQDYHEINMTAVDLLHVQEDDHILEIGFGPGVAIEEMARRASKGFIAGIDYSELMLAQAKRRNAEALQEGRVDLRHANVSQLPSFDKTFDKIIAINNAMYWDNQVESLWHLRQILKPGGTMAIVIQRHLEAIQYGQCNDEIGFYVECMRRAGFFPVEVMVEPVTKKNRKYTFSLGDYTKNRRNQEETLGCIYIYGLNPTINQMMMLYLNRQPAYARSRCIHLQKSNIDFLFQ